MKKNNKTYLVQFRATKEERKMIFDSAKKRGVSVSQYLRTVAILNYK